MSDPTDQTGRPDTAECDEVAPYLSAYVDSELTPVLQAKVTAHLATCQACARKAQRYREVHRQIASLPSTTPSPEVFERIQAAIAQRGHSPVVREPLHSAEQTTTAQIVRLLSPKVVYPEEPERDADEKESLPTSARAPLPKTPFHRRSAFLRGGLPALVALLIMTLTVALFEGLAHQGMKTSPTVRVTAAPTVVSDALSQTQSAILANTSKLAFTPLAPGYLPGGVQFVSATVQPMSATKATRFIDFTWTFPQQGGSATLHLRESLGGQSWGLLGCQNASAQFGSDWLEWGLPGVATWQPLTCDQQSAWPAVGQVHTVASAAGQSAAARTAPHANAANSPPSSVGGQSLTQLDLVFIVQPASANTVSKAIQEMRIASLSMDTSYQQQLRVKNLIGAKPQSSNGLYLHFIAQATSGGNSYSINGQTNEASSGSERARIEIVNTTAGADTIDVVNGTSALRLENSTYSIISYSPQQSLSLNTGQDGEPWSGAIQLLLTAASQMDSGNVWVVADTLSHPVAFHGHTAYELAVVNAPSQTLIYVDAQSNLIIGLQMTPGVSGGGGTGAPTPLVAPGSCPITYTDLWWGTEVGSLSLTPPSGYTKAATPITVGFQC